MHALRTWCGWLLAVLTITVMAGCADASPAPLRIAEQFYRAVSQDEGATACSLLAPQTVHEVEKSAQQRCRSAILDEDVPKVGAVTDYAHFGNHAQVQFRGETAFLARFQDGWRLTAVGCTPRPRLPYDCQVQG